MGTDEQLTWVWMSWSGVEWTRTSRWDKVGMDVQLCKKGQIRGGWDVDRHWQVFKEIFGRAVGLKLGWV